MRPSLRTRALRLSALLAAFAGVALAEPPNLVANGDFDRSLEDWERLGAVADSLWSGEDVDLDPASGSIWVRNRLLQPEFLVVRRQCIALAEPSHAYLVGASLQIDLKSVPGSGVFADFRFYENADCSGSSNGDAVVAEAPGWSLRTMTFRPEDLWFDAGSLEVTLGAFKNERSEGQASGYVDAVFAYADGLMRDGFDGGREPDRSDQP
ncbi:hypothetical protein [Dokdonella sp.]|uniref:hypothetical protein n=1 Tax=Dokdonella sp. TaxID=2291710 RepID=UPI001B007E39|nr:hypothetical protein [Dokdonella sp.]MBO9664177.1 hypothetical protein [Dokdonella sp.]